MANPTIKRIDQHPNLSGLAAIDDKLLGIDVSQANPANKTVLIAMEQLTIHNANQLGNDVVESTKIKDGAVTTDKIADDAVTFDKLADVVNHEIYKNLVYIQLYQPDEAIIAATGKTQFFVPSYLAGKNVRQLGIGIATAETGKTVTVQLGTSGAYGSIAGAATKEEAVSKTLPAALTKIPINVSVTTGSPAPKGLDFWFLVY